MGQEASGRSESRRDSDSGELRRAQRTPVQVDCRRLLAGDAERVLAAVFEMKSGMSAEVNLDGR